PTLDQVVPDPDGRGSVPQVIDTPQLGVNEKKKRVASALLTQAGNLVEFWSEMGEQGVDAGFARDCLARWLKDLPGDAWDTRLGDPDTV
ncbi:hypothetical protein, partial [Streptomyces javensis]